MSTYFAVTDGNFSDSTVFAGTLSAADRTDNVAGISINQVSITTAPFAANAGDSIYGVALHLSARNVTSTDTVTLNLQSVNGIKATETYPISSFTSYDGSNNLLTIYPQNWQLLKLTTPISVAATDTFTISLSASNNNQISFMGSAGGFNPAKSSIVFAGSNPSFYTASTPFTAGVSELSFDLRTANTNWLYHPYNQDFGFNSSEDFTVEGYFYFKSFPFANNPILHFGKGWNGGGWSSAWGIYYTTGDQNLYFYRYYEGVHQYYFNCVAPLATGRWIHIAVTRENGTLGIWVDGVLAGIQANNTVDYSGLPAPYDQLRIGYGASASTIQYQDMYVSNVRITKSALYTINTAIPAAPLPSVNNTAFLHNNSKTHAYTVSDSSNVQDIREFNLQAIITNAVDSNKNLWSGTANKTLSIKNPFNLDDTYSYYFDGGTFINSGASIGRGDALEQYKVVDAVSGSTLNASTAVLGVANGRLCAEFDGTTATRYIVVPGRDLALGVDDFTIECFVYPRARTATVPIIFRTVPGAEPVSNIMVQAGHFSFNANKYQLSVGNNSPIASSASDIIYNAWSHIAVVRRSNTLYLYVNGVQEASVPYTAIFTSTSDWNIGTDSNLNYTMFNGYISDFRVTGLALYTAPTITPPAYPLTANADTMLLAQTQNTSVVADNSLTIDAWVQIPSTTSAANRTIAISTRTNSTDGWQLYVKPNGTIAVKLLATGEIISGTTTLIPNRWYYVAFKGDAGDYKLYVDGTQEGTTYTGVIDLRSRNITLGARSSSEYFTGYIYDFRALDRVIDSSTTVPVASRTVADCPPSTDFYVYNNPPTSSSVSTKSPFKNASMYFQSGVASFADSNALKITTGPFTLEYWFKPITSDYAVIAGNMHWNDGHNNGWLLEYSDSCFGFSFCNGVRNNFAILNSNVVTSASPAAGSWMHVVISRDSSDNMLCFVNGVSLGFNRYRTGWNGGDVDVPVAPISQSFDLNTGVTPTPQFGAYTSQGNLRPFGNFYIANTRLNTSQCLYTSNFTKPTAPVTTTSQGSIASNVTLLTPANNAFLDTSSQRYIINNNSNAIVAKDSPFANTIVDSSLYFNGGTEVVTVDPYIANVFDLSTASNNIITYEFWMYTLDLPGAGNSCRLIMTGPNSSTTSLVWATFGPNGNMVAGLPWGGVVGISTPDNAIRINTWHHVAFTFNGSNASIFIDGQLRARITNFTRPGSANNALRFGYTDSTGTVNHPYKGYFTNFRIVKGVELYTTNFTVPTAPLPFISDTVYLLKFPFTSMTGSMPNIPGPLLTGDAESMVFNGTTNFYESVQSLPSVSDYGDLTIEFWFNRYNDTTTYEQVLDLRPSDISSGCVIDINLYGNKHLNFYEHNGATRWSISQAPITPNAWHNVIIQRKNGVIYFIYDGTLTGAVASSDPQWFGGTVLLGNHRAVSNRFKGYLSNVKISSRAVYDIDPSTNTITIPGKLSYDDGTLFLATAPYNNQYKFSSTLLKAASPIKGKMTLPFTYTPFTAGPISDSMFFEGSSNSGISLPANNNYKLGVGKTPFTIEVWVYMLTPSTHMYAVVAGSNTGSNTWGNIAYQLLFTSNDYFYWQAHTSAGHAQSIVHDSIRPSSRINKWTHIAVQYDGRYTRIFVNGAPSGQVLDLGTGEYQSALYDCKLCVGEGLSRENPMHGLISNLRIINGAAIYPNVGFIPPTSRLTNVANTVLLAQSPYAVPFNSKDLTPPAPPASTNADDMLFFDGTTGLITADPIASITGDFTIEFWVYRLRLNAGREYFLDGRANSSVLPWFVGTHSGNTLRVGYIPADLYAGTLTPKTWNYINLTRSNGIFTMSLNGRPVSITGNVAAEWGGNRLLIGRLWDNDHNMLGYLSNIRIIKGSVLNSSKFTPSTSPLTVLPRTTFLLKPGADLDKYVVSAETKALSALNTETLAASTFTPLTSASNRSATDPDYFKMGVSNWIQFDHHADFNLHNVDYTLEAWAYISNGNVSGQNGSDGNFRLFAKMNCHCHSGNFQFFVNSGNKVCVWYGEWCTTHIGNAVAPTNQWFHIAFVGAGGQIKIYINGELKDTFTTPIFANNLHSLYVGGNESCGNYGHGYISNARVIKNKAEYTANFTPARQLTTTPETVLLVQNPYNTFNGKTYTAFRADATSVINPNTGSPAYTFNGTNNLVRLHPDPHFNDMYGKEFTFEAWVKPTGSGTNRVILTRRMTFGNFTISWYVYIDSSNFVHNHNLHSDQRNQTPIPNDVWTHVALVCDKTFIYLYINGIYNHKFDNLPSANTQLYYYPITIGYGAYGGEYFQGSISDIRLVTDQMMYTPQIAPAVPTIPLGLDGSGTTVLLFTDPYNNPDRVYQTSSGSVAFIVNSTFDANVLPQSDPVADTPFTDSLGAPLGSSVYFFGGLESKNTYMRSVELPAMGLNADNGEFTVEFWFKDTRTTSTQQCLFDNRQVGAQNLVIDLNAYSSYSVKARLNNIDVHSGPNVYTANTWNHVAVTRKGGIMMLLVNGKVVNSAGVPYTSTTGQIAAAEMWIGTYNANQGSYFRGYMSNIRIVSNRAVYSVEFPLPTSAPADIPGKTPLLITSALYNPAKNYEYYPPSSNTLVSSSPFTSVGVDNPLSFVRDQIIIPPNQEIDLYGVEWTMETWIYPYFPNGSWRCICTKKTTTGGQYRSYSLFLHPSYNGIHFGVFAGNQSDANTPMSVVDLYPNAWSHVALVCDGTITKLYINGKYAHTYSFAPSFDINDQPLVIGRDDNQGNAGNFEGYLSNFRIVRGKQLYTADFTPSTTPLDAVPYTSILLKNPYTPPNYIAYATPTNIHISSSLLGDTVIPISINVDRNTIVNNLWIHNKATLNVPINNNITLDVLGVSGLQVTSEGTLNIT